MSGDVVAIMLGAGFTAGCITIHELRAHARAMTPYLGTVALCLGALVALVAISALRPTGGERPVAGTARGGAPTQADFSMPRR